MKVSNVTFIAIVALWASVEVGMAQDARIARQEAAKSMSRANIDGVELEYETRGNGEPVVLVHAGIFADWFKPLVDEPGFAGRYRVVSYHRARVCG